MQIMKYIVQNTFMQAKGYIFFQYTISEQNEFLRNCTSPQFPCNSDLFSFYETSCIYCSYFHSLIYSSSFRYHPTISIIYRTFSPFMFSVVTKRVGFNPFVSYLFFFVNSSLFFWQIKVLIFKAFSSLIWNYITPLTVVILLPPWKTDIHSFCYLAPTFTPTEKMPNTPFFFLYALFLYSINICIFWDCSLCDWYFCVHLTHRLTFTLH